MQNTNMLAEEIQHKLGPYAKSREQVNYIRRILAAHLGECAHGAPIKSALALASGSDAHGTVTTDSTPADGVYRDYLEALQENINARRELDAIRQQEMPEMRATATAAFGGSSRRGLTPSPMLSLNERVALLKLHQKRDGLYAVQETLDLLLEQPAADSRFLDAERMLQGTPPLPPVPRDVINTMVMEQSNSALDMAGQITQLEKVVLRAKLLLRQEEQLLHEARLRTPRQSAPSGQAARLSALSATRDELIHWIETELGKAAPEIQETQKYGDDLAEKNLGKADSAAIQATLGKIREKYTWYVAARKRLLEMVGSGVQSLPPPSKKPIPKKRASYAATEPRLPTDHLVVPYLAALVEVSANHKVAVVYKTHMTSLLNQTSQEIRRRVSHLAEESQLLSSFAEADGSRNRRLGVETASQADISTQAKAWADASDTAKMSTLESVAETIEKGQIALEGLMRTVDSIAKITGQDLLVTGEEGRWLPDTPKERRHTRNGSRAQSQSSTDPWSKVRGNLGLLGQDSL
ncbi:hypothetical protein NQ176_g5155 [Zarea fungicola]|uniref:Uncharacterized protein n=1 Tax=Zarea fungicola TaxID=93591 RepID=A0ACC1NAJ1_9HYPO|nr:hypothetical protein NQ176_g5155 [Lecanicillium fungicola]